MYISTNKMGTTMKSPILTPSFQELQGHEQGNVTCVSIQGWRDYMEDFSSFTDIGDGNLLCGVFDGHGGPQVAKYVSQILSTQILNQPFYRMKNFPRALANVFKRVDEMIESTRGDEQMKKIRKQLKHFPSNEHDPIKMVTGSTANVVLLTPDRIFVSNIGDTRSVLCSKNKAISLSTDHKPVIPAQKARITKAGGFIQNNRINGSINISRTFGDFSFKTNQNKQYHEQMVISVPEVKQVQRKKDQDNYVVIASDGVWQKFGANNQDLIDRINSIYSHSANWKETLQKFLHSLVAGSQHEKTGHDNMTIMIIQLQKNKNNKNSEQKQKKQKEQIGGKE